MQVDENIYAECRIAEYCYRREDVKSKRVQGKPIVFDKRTP